ncbi:MAG: hypothetical protein LUD72_05815, partial [Bacteroidales bacterium]|nr:hypothetical protein [Bacteroidales bacterium]
SVMKLEISGISCLVTDAIKISFSNQKVTNFYYLVTSEWLPTQTRMVDRFIGLQKPLVTR